MRTLMTKAQGHTACILRRMPLPVHPFSRELRLVFESLSPICLYCVPFRFIFEDAFPLLYDVGAYIGGSDCGQQQ